MAHKHSVYDTDAHFSINPFTRAIKNESTSKVAVIQHDHNSERFTFEIPRLVDGHDMSVCDRVEVHYINMDSANKDNISADIYEVDDLQVSPDDGNFVICSWLLSQNATKYAGSLNFLVRFICLDGEKIAYAWHTAIFTGISVSSGILNNAEEIVEPYVDVLAQWKADLFGVGDTEEQRLLTVSAEQQAAIAAKGAAVLETIPEEYTALNQNVEGNAAKINELASAIKGELSGAVVFADDVSPVEHKPAVKVRSKNLFLCMAAGKAATMSGVTFTYNDDGSVKLQGTATASSNFGVGEVYLDDGTYYLCDFAVGDFPDNFQARIQIYSDSTEKSIATLNNFESVAVGGGDSFIPAGWYQCRIRIDGGHAYDCTLYPTLFKAEQPTEYIPNVSDLTVATVSRYGKNLFKVLPNTINGVTISKKNDYFVLNGTATASNNFVVYIGHLPAGKYTLSANNPSNNGVDWSLIDVYSSDPYSIIAVKDNSNNGKATAQLAESEYLCRIRIESGVTYNNFVIKPQLEVGDTATDYEAYTEPTTHIPAADGTVSGMTSLSPCMTILTDTDGAIVECEYNIDTKTYIDRKIKELMEGVTE